MGVGLFLVGPTGKDWGRRLPGTGVVSLPSLASVPLGNGDIMNYLNAVAGLVQSGPLLGLWCLFILSFHGKDPIVSLYKPPLATLLWLYKLYSFPFSSLTLDAWGMACSYSWSAFQT